LNVTKIGQYFNRQTRAPHPGENKVMARNKTQAPEKDPVELYELARQVIVEMLLSAGASAVGSQLYGVTDDNELDIRLNIRLAV